MLSVQVQLLVSESDVENYKMIKADLDDLRLMVEKSELWVYKAKAEDKPEKKKKDGGDKVSSNSETNLCFHVIFGDIKLNVPA